MFISGLILTSERTELPGLFGTIVVASVAQSSKSSSESLEMKESCRLRFVVFEVVVHSEHATLMVLLIGIDRPRSIVGTCSDG